MAKEETPAPRGLARTLQTLARYRPLIIPTMIVGFVVGAVALWWNYGPALVGSHPDRYEVQLERIHLNAPPAWIKSDVRGEVFHDAGWHQQPLSILEGDLTVRVAQAFEQHTWVRKVTRVTKGPPATLHVELEYRRPVAMVEVDYQGQGGLLPVDAEGVLLPPENFTPEDAVTYPRITVDYVGPGGSIGTPWGDERVAGGAKIAALLYDDWRSLGLYRIVALPSTQPMSVAPTNYELRTRGDARVSWGAAPGMETAGESLAEQKVARLQRHVEQHGALDSGEGPQVIDLRGEVELSNRPRETPR